MKHLFQPKWYTYVVAIALLFALLPANAILAHPPLIEQNAPEKQSADVQSDEITLDAAYFLNNGTLDGLTVTDKGLVVADGATSGVYLSAEISTSLNRVSDIVPLWKANLANEEDVLIETRVRPVGGAWSGWEANPYAYYPVRNDEFAGNLIWIGGDKMDIQLRITLHGVSNLEYLTLFFNDNTAGPTDNDIAMQMASVQSTENSCPAEQPAIVSRTHWGNPYGQNSPRLAPRYAPMTHIIVHQSETPNTLGYGQDYSSVVRCIWNFHTNILRWGDVGYNYMIDPNGVIYEGRAGNHNADGTYVTQSGGDVVGIHDTRNVGSVSIGFLGCYGGCDDPRLSIATPTQAMQDSAVELMSWKMTQWNINPTSSANYNGLSNIPVIAGGRDVSWTTSPGTNIYNLLPTWREDTKERTECTVEPTPTPTDDGSNGTPTPTPDVTETPTATPELPTATPAPLSCQITDIAFDQEQYRVGDTVNLKLKLADADGNPLVGANVDVTVEKTVAIQSFDEIPFLDQTGLYEGSYSNTDVAGSYKFGFRASDPTGTRFAPCTAEEFVLVVGDGSGNPTSTPVATETPTTETPTPEVTETPVTVTPEVTETPVTETPTNTPTPTETPVTVTPEVTVTPTTPPTTVPANSLEFAPKCTESGSTILNVTNAELLRGVDMEITFDPSVGQVASIVEGSVFDGDNGLVVIKEVDNTNGIIKFAATVLGNNTINDSAELLSINWASINGGPAQVRVQNLTLVDDNDIKITVNAGVVDAAYIASDCSNITSGSVVLQGRTDNSGGIITTVGGQQVETSVKGSFIIVGDTVASVSVPGYLSAAVNEGTGVTATTAEGHQERLVGSITLLAGDVNNDNKINIFDLSYMASHFGEANAQGDLNGDGMVNIFDLSLAARNYNESGPLTNWQ